MLPNLLHKFSRRLNRKQTRHSYATSLGLNGDQVTLLIDLLGEKQFCKIAATPRFQRGYVELYDHTIEFNDVFSFFHMIIDIYAEDRYRFSSIDNPYIIDCGANIGLVSLYCKSIYPNSTIVAFEPDPEIFDILQANVERNKLTNVALHNKAVWTSEESLSFQSDGSWGGSVDQNGGKLSKLSVDATDLNQFLTRKIDLLKIDIEGSEHNVIPHCIELIKNNVDNLCFEWHSHSRKPSILGAILAELEDTFTYRFCNSWCIDQPFGEKPDFVFDNTVEIFLSRKNTNL